MAAKKGAVSKSAGLDELKADLKAETLKNAYIFYGEETYLRQSYLDQVREALVPAGFEEFNYHRLGGKGLSMQTLQETVEAMPMMAQHTLVTVTDLDIFKLDMSARGAFIEIISDIPEYCTVIFIYDLVAYKRDGKMKKLVAALDEHVREVEFCQQDRELLLRWIKRRFAADGHDIDAATADHLLFTCGSLMTDLLPEIGKVSAFAKGQSVTIADINAVVEPRLEARVFDMTRAITAGSYNEAAHILGELLRQRTEPIMILAAVGTVYILRTGDGMLSVSVGEQRARNWLERVLLFRPRTKEFLIAYPAIAAAYCCAAHRSRLTAWLFGVFGAIGFASVANTFCHIRAHFLVSLLRTGLGLVLGLVLGILILLILRVFWPVPSDATQTKE